MSLFDTLTFFAAAALEPSWHKTWPFGPGLEEGFFPVVSKGLFIAAILGGMAWLLRWLFGPGGPLREKEFDEPDPEAPTPPAPKPLARTADNDPHE